jgi:hypothetical protein
LKISRNVQHAPSLRAFVLTRRSVPRIAKSARQG